MEFAITRLSEKGQLVIPKDIREAAGLKEGMKLIVIADHDTIVLQKLEVAGGKWKLKELLTRTKEIALKLGLSKT